MLLHTPPRASSMPRTTASSHYGGVDDSKILTVVDLINLAGPLSKRDKVFDRIRADMAGYSRCSEVPNVAWAVSSQFDSTIDSKAMKIASPG